MSCLTHESVSEAWLGYRLRARKSIVASCCCWRTQIRVLRQRWSRLCSRRSAEGESTTDRGTSSLPRYKTLQFIHKRPLFVCMTRHIISLHRTYTNFDFSSKVYAPVLQATHILLCDLDPPQSRTQAAPSVIESDHRSLAMISPY